MSRWTDPQTGAVGDIFRSDTNPSKVTIGGVQGRNIMTPVPGIDGAFSQYLGWQPRRIIVEGVLDGTSVANLKANIQVIIQYIDHQTSTLTDNFGLPHSYVKMESFRYGSVPGGFNSQITQRGINDYITFYQCMFTQVSPGTAQP